METIPYEDVAFQENKLSEPKLSMTEQDDAPTPEEGDKYIGMEVLIPIGYRYQCTIVAQMKQNFDGELIVIHNANPKLDTRLYEVVFPGEEGV